MNLESYMLEIFKAIFHITWERHGLFDSNFFPTYLRLNLKMILLEAKMTLLSVGRKKTIQTANKKVLQE